MPDLPHRDKAERTLAMILLPEFERQTDVLLRGGLKPLPESQWLAMRSGLATAMEPQLRRTYRLAALLLLTDLSVPLDADDLFSGWESDLANRSRHYARWRAARVGEWMQGSIRRRYEALAAKAEANALAAEEVANEIKKILDEARAERVAANETTASVTAGETGMADVARQYGGPVIVARWNTERDERTCHICWPLHRQSLTEVPLELQAGPPAHDLCRCWLTWELKDAEVGAAVMESVFLENCGSGDKGNPGFQVGNTCAKGGGNQTDSAAFKEWFGDSKVVDENGEPLVVYHGTDVEYTEFANGRREGGAIFFSSSARQAAEFAGTSHGAAIKPVYLKMANPYRVSFKGNLYTPEAMEKVIAIAQRRGHDGVIVRNIQNFEGGKLSTSYAVFDPNQIKSATGNRGTFRKDSADITESSLLENCGSGAGLGRVAERTGQNRRMGGTASGD